MEIFNAVHQLAALAHETRLAVFRTLVQAGPAGVPAGEIATKHALPVSSLSFHLNILSNADLVTSTREGRIVRYAPNFPLMQALLAYLTENCCAGSSCPEPARPNPKKRNA